MVATAAYPTPLQAPTQAFPFTDGTGLLTALGMSTLNAMWNALNGAQLIIPCSCTQASVNILILTPLITSPKPQQRDTTQVGTYTFSSTWSFVAAATITGAATAQITPLAALSIFKTNGGAALIAGDITIGRQYFLTYVDTLSAGAGGFVLR